MIAVINFIFFIAGGLLTVLVWAILINVVLSWLFAFGVINPHNRVVGQIAYALDSFVRPFLDPVRRFLPSLGGLDLSPIVVLLVIRGVQVYLLPAAHVAALNAFAG